MILVRMMMILVRMMMILVEVDKPPPISGG